jgi:DNA transformation protein
MPVSADYLEYMQELLDWLPALRTRRMFGGVGFYSDGLFFALADDGALYLKGDGLSEPVYREGGAEQFTYQAKGKTVRLNYWSVPAEVLEEPEALRQWVRLALDAALRARK